MRTYLILRERREAVARGRRIQALVAELGNANDAAVRSKYSPAHRDTAARDRLRSRADRASRLGYEPSIN